MRKIGYILVFLFLKLYCWSQDTIQLRNGTLISSKVIEVNSNSVKYKKNSNLNGPDYIESKDNIICINYNNGLVDSILVKEEFKPTIINDLPQMGKISVVERKYFYLDPIRNGNLRSIGEREILIICKNKAKGNNSQDLIRLIRKTKFETQKSRISMVFGVTTIAMCGMVCISSLMQYPNAYKTQSQVNEIKKEGLVIGASGLILGLGFETLAFFQHNKKKKRLLETVTLYNSLLK